MSRKRARLSGVACCGRLANANRPLFALLSTRIACATGPASFLNPNFPAVYVEPGWLVASGGSFEPPAGGVLDGQLFRGGQVHTEVCAWAPGMAGRRESLARRVVCLAVADIVRHTMSVERESRPCGLTIPRRPGFPDSLARTSVRTMLSGEPDHPRHGNRGGRNSRPTPLGARRDADRHDLRLHRGGSPGWDDRQDAEDD